MTKTVRKTRAFIEAVLRGMDSPADVHCVNQYPYPHASEVDAMRKDWERIGGDIKDVMKRANGKAPT